MSREEYYQHRTLDHIEALSEYVEIMMDGAMEVSLTTSEIKSIYHGLIVLQGEVSRQLQRLE